MTTCIENNPSLNTNGLEEYSSCSIEEFFLELCDIPSVGFEVDRYTWTLPDGSKVWVYARNEYAAKNIIIDLHERYHRLQEILQRHTHSNQPLTTGETARFYAACIRVLGVPLNQIPQSFSSLTADELAKGLSDSIFKTRSNSLFTMDIGHSFGFE
jgi:hypothetical protein